MSKAGCVLLASICGLLSMQATAEEGLVRIDQAAVKTAGGFPFKITQPGSYRLTSNLVVPATANGIMVPASNVFLDLNGFSISCSGNQLAGITDILASPIKITNVQVKHGAVTGCGTAVYLADTLLSNVEDLAVSNYTEVGIQLFIGNVRRSTLLGSGLNGTGVNGSVGLFLVGGIVESNHFIGDFFGISGAPSLVTGNVIEASQSALLIESQFSMIGNNVLIAPGTGSSAVSQGNNLCSFKIC
jgi:hypothetical protein